MVLSVLLIFIFLVRQSLAREARAEHLAWGVSPRIGVSRILGARSVGQLKGAKISMEWGDPVVGSVTASFYTFDRASAGVHAPG